MPRKTFVNGQILTESDLNDFLMNQSVMVFDDSAARSSAIGTAVEGMVTYLKDTDVLSKWNGSSWVDINDIPKSLLQAGGDLITASASGVPARLAAGTPGYFLQSNGTSLSWSAVSSAPGFYYRLMSFGNKNVDIPAGNYIFVARTSGTSIATVTINGSEYNANATTVISLPAATSISGPNWKTVLGITYGSAISDNAKPFTYGGTTYIKANTSNQMAYTSEKGDTFSYKTLTNMSNDVFSNGTLIISGLDSLSSTNQLRWVGINDFTTASSMTPITMVTGSVRVDDITWGDNLWIFVGGTGANANGWYATSTSGTSSFTTAALGGTARMTTAAYAPITNKYVIGNATGNIWSSTNGSTWTQRVTSGFGSGPINKITWDGTRFFAVGGASGVGTMLTSTDGASWTSVTLPFTISTFRVESVSGVYWLSRVFSGSSYEFYYSENLTTWTLIRDGNGDNLDASIEFDANKYRLLAGTAIFTADSSTVYPYSVFLDSKNPTIELA